MKLRLKMDDVVIVRAMCNEYKKKDGTQGAIYSIGFDDDSTVGQLQCSKELYDYVGTKKYIPGTLLLEYNSDYNSLRIIDVVFANE